MRVLSLEKGKESMPLLWPFSTFSSAPFERPTPARTCPMSLRQCECVTGEGDRMDDVGVAISTFNSAPLEASTPERIVP